MMRSLMERTATPAGWVSFWTQTKAVFVYCLLFVRFVFVPSLSWAHYTVLPWWENATKQKPVPFLVFLIHRLILTSDVFSLVCLCLLCLCVSVSVCVCLCRGLTPARMALWAGFSAALWESWRRHVTDSPPPCVQNKGIDLFLLGFVCFGYVFPFLGLSVLAVLARNHMIDETTCMPTEQKCAWYINLTRSCFLFSVSVFCFAFSVFCFLQAVDVTFLSDITDRSGNNREVIHTGGR